MMPYRGVTCCPQLWPYLPEVLTYMIFSHSCAKTISLHEWWRETQKLWKIIWTVKCEEERLNTWSSIGKSPLVIFPREIALETSGSAIADAPAFTSTTLFEATLEICVSLSELDPTFPPVDEVAVMPSKAFAVFRMERLFDLRGYCKGWGWRNGNVCLHATWTAIAMTLPQTISFTKLIPRAQSTHNCISRRPRLDSTHLLKDSVRFISATILMYFIDALRIVLGI